jgi:uncharacterized integral membrane protein
MAVPQTVVESRRRSAAACRTLYYPPPLTPKFKRKFINKFCPAMAINVAVGCLAARSYKFKWTLASARIRFPGAFRIRFAFLTSLYYAARNRAMNPKLLLKTIFVIAILSLLVIMGMNNRQDVDLSMPPFLKTILKAPAALMYFGFFAVGVLTGTIMIAGSGKGRSKSKSE